MAKARDLKRRIRSVENTRQITKTMEMVAASKLKRAQDLRRRAAGFTGFSAARSGGVEVGEWF